LNPYQDSDKAVDTIGHFDIPAHRPLKVYAFDPTLGRTLGNYMMINAQYEKLLPGPTGKYLEVIVYDANNKCYYEPVELDDPKVLLRNGLDPSESNPQFHQQMVYVLLHVKQLDDLNPHLAVLSDGVLAGGEEERQLKRRSRLKRAAKDFPTCDARGKCLLKQRLAGSCFWLFSCS